MSVRAALFVVLAISGTSWGRVVPIGPEFQVNTYTDNHQLYPSVSSDDAGNFLVVWESWGGQDGDATGVFGQRYDNVGRVVGPEFQVNTFTTGNQQAPSTTSDGAGDFVVAWASDRQDTSGYGVFAQRYDATGTAVGLHLAL